MDIYFIDIMNTKFEMAYRFNNPRYNVLPINDQRGIFPVSKDIALQAWRMLFGDHVNHIAEISAGSPINLELIENTEVDSDSIESGTESLRDTLLPGNNLVLVLWSKEIAALTLSSIFTTYWDDFCYPGDDIVVWHEGEKIVLYSEGTFKGYTVANE